MSTLHLQWFLLNKGFTFVLMFFVVMNAWCKSDLESLEKDLFFLVNGNSSLLVMQVWGFCSRVVELHVLPGCDFMSLGNLLPVFWDHSMFSEHWEPIT